MNGSAATTIFMAIATPIHMTTYEYLWSSFVGQLPDPENVTLSSQNSSTTELQWNPPYYTLNQESDIIHVDPMITQYTVYTIDAYTSRMIESLNKTVTSFTVNTTTQNDHVCPMYQVSAWNVGGEGELSEPVQESTPRGKLAGKLT